MTRSKFIADDNILFAGLFFLYIALGFSGYGNDNDTFGLIYSGTKLILEGDYFPSRPPGYFIPELIIGFGSLLGGFVASNTVSAVLAILSLLLYRDILQQHFSADNARQLMLMTGLNPYFVIAASSSIDYIYSIFFILAAVSCYLQKRSYWGGALLALAIGSRLSNSLIIAIICLYFLYESYSHKHPSELHERFASMVLAVVLSSILYIPSFVEADKSLGFLTYVIGDFSWTDLLIRFVYKNIYLLGILPICVFASSLMIGYRNSNLSLLKSLLLVFPIAIILVQETLFFKVPLEISYLLPILFVLFPLWFVMVKPALVLQRMMLAMILVYGFLFNIQLLQITYYPGHVMASTAKVRPHLEKGVIVKDVLARRETGAQWAPITGEKRFFVWSSMFHSP